MKLLLAGISGYGAYYMKLLTEFADLSENPLCGVVDPYPENSPWLTWLREHNVPVYPSLEAFYEQEKVGRGVSVVLLPHHADPEEGYSGRCVREAYILFHIYILEAGRRLL